MVTSIYSLMWPWRIKINLSDHSILKGSNSEPPPFFGSMGRILDQELLRGSGFSLVHQLLTCKHSRHSSCSKPVRSVIYTCIQISQAQAQSAAVTKGEIDAQRNFLCFLEKGRSWHPVYTTSHPNSHRLELPFVPNYIRKMAVLTWVAVPRCCLVMLMT